MFNDSVQMVTLESMARVLKYIEDHQAASGVCPENYSAIGRAVSLSHTHVRRLINRAVREGLLERKSGGVSYTRVVGQGIKVGGVRVPRTTVSWESPMRLDDEDEAVWLDPQFFDIHPRFPHWLVRFRSPEPREHPSRLSLGPHLSAIVRKCPPHHEKAATTTWWLVEDTRGQVAPMELINPKEFFLPDLALGRRGFTIRVDEAVQAVRIVKLLECREP